MAAGLRVIAGDGGRRTTVVCSIRSKHSQVKVMSMADMLEFTNQLSGICMCLADPG